MTSRPRIAVFPSAQYARYERVLAALADLYPAQFVPSDALGSTRFDAALLLGATPEDAVRTADAGLRCMAFVDGDLAVSEAIAFGRTPRVPHAFRGATLRDPSLARIGDLGHQSHEAVIAEAGERVLWARRASGSASADLVAVRPPALSSSDYLYSHFNDERWFALVPLLHFVREVSGWQPPAARACFMFDDPNLHWISYGYVKYGDVARSAARHNYHVSFATVPMDGWYVNQRAARLFRENPDRLSLLVHGNDHTYRELSQRLPRERQQAIATQALERIVRLESASGVGVSRVMAAPHGACSDSMATALLHAGFEGACISRSSLMARNPGLVWPASLGVGSAMFFGGGLPVIPRFNIHAEASTRVRFSMFLGQPVIPIGHHQDVKDGLDRLEHVSALVNSIGGVEWSSPSDILRRNFHVRQTGPTLHVRMYARLVQLDVPANVTQVQLDRPWLAGGQEPVTIHSSAAPPSRLVQPEGEAFRVEPGSRVTISCEPADPWPPARPSAARPTVRAVLRRQLCEVRDRLAPATEWWSARRVPEPRPRPADSPGPT